MVLAEEKKPIHLFTIHADRLDFKGFQKELEFFLHTVNNSAVRTVWTTDKRNVTLARSEKGRLCFDKVQELNDHERAIIKHAIKEAP